MKRALLVIGPMALLGLAGCAANNNDPAATPTATDAAPAMSPQGSAPSGEMTTPPINPSTPTPPGIDPAPPSTVPPEKMPE
ncbi:MAG: hypothetical protein ABWZ40_01460 [Caulobacterales bacterium]